MRLHQTSFNVWLHAEEIKLRGLYLTINVDFDFSLLLLIHECFISNLEEIKTFYKGKELTELTMFERISVCEKGLAKYYSKAYKKYKHHFILINKLRLSRNKFAHQKIDDNISPNDKTKLTFHELKKKFRIKQTEYHIADLYEELNVYKNTMQETLQLVSTIMKYSD